MFCKYCGNKIKDTDVTCPYCGKERDRLQSASPLQQLFAGRESKRAEHSRRDEDGLPEGAPDGRGRKAAGGLPEGAPDGHGRKATGELPERVQGRGAHGDGEVGRRQIQLLFDGQRSLQRRSRNQTFVLRILLGLFVLLLVALFAVSCSASRGTRALKKQIEKLQEAVGGQEKTLGEYEKRLFQLEQPETETGSTEEEEGGSDNLQEPQKDASGSLQEPQKDASGNAQKEAGEPEDAPNAEKGTSDKVTKTKSDASENTKTDNAPGGGKKNDE